MPTPTVITDLDPVAANNFPAGSNAPSVLDDVQRAHGGFIRNLLDATQSQAYTAFTTAGTATTYTLTPIPAITAYAAGQSFWVTFNAASGAAPTLAISGVATPPNLVKQIANGTFANVAAGDIPINHRSRVTLISATQALVDLPAAKGWRRPGTIFAWGGATAPAGSLACPLVATNISRTTYADLFAAIGTTWGVGDGSTTFGMPYMPENYAIVQANANVGTATTGEVKAHTHPSTGGASPDSRPIGGGVTEAATAGSTTGSTGGAANLAAGVRMLWCVEV